MATVEDTMGVLGGRQVFGRRVVGSDAAIPLIERGFPFAALDRLRAALGLDPGQLSVVLGVPMRTLARRKAKRRLAPAESDRAYRLARLFAQASATLGSEDKARGWLTRPNRALGRRTPLELAGTDAGAREVERALGRIEHGVFS